MTMLLMMMLMILAVFNERVRVRAYTLRGVVPPRQVATAAKTSKLQLRLRRGPWAGARGFRADNPNPLVLPHGSDRLVHLFHQRITVGEETPYGARHAVPFKGSPGTCSRSAWSAE